MEFATKYKLPQNIFDLSQQTIFAAVEYFACFLRVTRNITSEAISQYITHVTTSTREEGLPQSIFLRSQRLKFILKTFHLSDTRRTPQRLSLKIPLTADLVWRLLDFIDRHYSGTPDALLLKACISLGYLLGHRPCEYLDVPKRRSAKRKLISQADEDDQTDVTDELCEAPSSHPILARSCFFKWPDDDNLYSAIDGRHFPAGKAEAIFEMMDSSKTDKFGKGVPLCGAAAPPSSRFDCLDNITTYLRSFPPLAGSPLLSGYSGLATPSSTINTLLKNFARSVGLDPSRLLPHSIRVGNTVQTDALPTFDQLQTSGHRSFGGKMPYCRKTLGLAHRASAFLYDTSVQPLDQLRFIYMTGSA
jgi:hypothetical protein